jgi:hypothetical protein
MQNFIKRRGAHKAIQEAISNLNQNQQGNNDVSNGVDENKKQKTDTSNPNGVQVDNAAPPESSTSSTTTVFLTETATPTFTTSTSSMPIFLSSSSTESSSAFSVTNSQSTSTSIPIVNIFPVPGSRNMAAVIEGPVPTTIEIANPFPSLSSGLPFPFPTANANSTRRPSARPMPARPMAPHNATITMAEDVATSPETNMNAFIEIFGCILALGLVALLLLWVIRIYKFRKENGVVESVTETASSSYMERIRRAFVLNKSKTMEPMPQNRTSSPFAQYTVKSPVEQSKEMMAV